MAYRDATHLKMTQCYDLKLKLSNLVFYQTLKTIHKALSLLFYCSCITRDRLQLVSFLQFDYHYQLIVSLWMILWKKVSVLWQIISKYFIELISSIFFINCILWNEKKRRIFCSQRCQRIVKKLSLMTGQCWCHTQTHHSLTPTMHIQTGEMSTRATVNTRHLLCRIQTSQQPVEISRCGHRQRPQI